MLAATKDLTVRICIPTPHFPDQVKLPESEIKPTQQGQSCLRPLERGGWDRRKGKGDRGRKAQGERSTQSLSFPGAHHKHGNLSEPFLNSRKCL